MHFTLSTLLASTIALVSASPAQNPQASASASDDLFDLLGTTTLPNGGGTVTMASYISRVSTFYEGVTKQPKWSSVVSVLETALPESVISAMEYNGGALPSSVTTESWWKALPSDVIAYEESVGSELLRLMTGTGDASQPAQTASSAQTGSTTQAPSSPNKNAAPQVMDGWRSVRNTLVGVAGAVAGVAMIL